MALPFTFTAGIRASAEEVTANFQNHETRIVTLENGAFTAQTTKTAAYTATGLEARLDLDLAAGATVTLPLAALALYQKQRLAIVNLGDAGTWTVALSGSNTFAGGSTSVSLPPGQSLEIYVGKRGDGTYRWTKV